MIVALIWIELAFYLLVPIDLWGWKIGIIVFSGLSSLLHIVQLLKKIAGVAP